MLMHPYANPLTYVSLTSTANVVIFKGPLCISHKAVI